MMMHLNYMQTYRLPRGKGLAISHHKNKNIQVYMNLISYQFEILIRKTKENDVINHVTLIWALVWILLIMLALYLSIINLPCFIYQGIAIYFHVLHDGSYPHKLGSTITLLSITVRLIRARFVRLAKIRLHKN